MADHSRSASAPAVPRGGPGGAAGGGRRGSITGVVSSCALVFSAVSLYETVLRQPELAIHVAPVIHYTHEDGREALAIPVTIANHGARDGTVLTLALTATTAGRAEPKTFYSAYVVGSGYFDKSKLVRSVTGGLTSTKDRPKLPFAPLTISGRNSYSGTILFFPRGKDFPRLITEAGQFSLTLTPNPSMSDGAASWLDKLWAARMRPATFSVKLEQFDIRTVQRGDTIELRDASW